MVSLPTPHGDKLNALLQNKKLPSPDYPRVEEAIKRYNNWLKEIRDVSSNNYEEVVNQMVGLLNTYMEYLEVDLIFDSKEDFLYRQKGQLKLNSSVIEEFLPWLVTKSLSNQLKKYHNLAFGPTTCFSSVRFESSITSPKIGGGLYLKEKDHDFAISRKLFIRTSYQKNFKKADTKGTNIAYVVAECKTNLDKTMFQEAAATAMDIKTAVPGARYFLLCEWLDMTPISTAITTIDEVLILRKSRRLESNIREKFNTAKGREQNRDIFLSNLREHPLAIDVFLRFIEHVRKLIIDDEEDNILTRGYF